MPKELTLNEALSHLKKIGKPFKMPTLRKAISTNKLKSRLVEGGPYRPYRVVNEDDLAAWAFDDTAHQAGHKAGQPIKRKDQS